MAKEASPKRIVKRITKAESVPASKVVLKKPVKRNASVKSVPIKNKVKATTPKAVPVSKSRSKKISSRNSLLTESSIASPLTPSNIIRERILAKVRAEATIQKMHSDTIEAVSFVEGEPAKRLKEKVAIFQKIVDERGPEIMAQVARSSGYTFIFLGLLFLYANALSLPQGAIRQAANAICITDNCNTVQNLPSIPEIIPEPSLTFVAVPSVVTEQSMISLLVDNVNDHSLHLVSRTDGRTHEITNKRNSGDGRVDYLVNPSSVPSGIYAVRVTITGLAGTPIIFTANSSIEFIAPISSNSAPTPSITSVNPEPDQSTNNQAQTVTATPSTAPTPENPQSPVTNNLGSQNSSVQSPEQSVVTQQLTPSLLVEPDTNNVYRLTLSGVTTTEPVVVQATLLQSVTPIFLGVMYRAEREHVYWLDGLSLPSGQYQISAVVRNSQGVTTLARVPFSHVRTSTTTQVVNTRPLPTIKPEIPVTSTSAVPVVAMGFGSVIETSPSTPITSSNQEADTLARTLLEQNSDTLTDLVVRLALADETNDINLRRLASREIDAEVRKLVSLNALQSNNVTAADLEGALRARLDSVTSQIDRFRSLTAAEAAERKIDSDGDGISDYDEINLYGTDPFNPDTDGDGVIDGIEIIRGFDPLNPNPEAVISYESPKTVGYINENKLGIWSVEPLVEYTEDLEIKSVQAVIRGFGLPNSFVTLYIFSTPTIITVRTAEDGSFEYIFTKELEDGAHEVYVAITDNTGAIVARSNAFAFVKTAQAFTYTDDSSSALVGSLNSSSDNSVAPYYMVAAMGVITFGIILLLLGHSLRRREDEVIPA